MNQLWLTFHCHEFLFLQNVNVECFQKLERFDHFLLQIGRYEDLSIVEQLNHILHHFEAHVWQRNWKENNALDFWPAQNWMSRNVALIHWKLLTFDCMASRKFVTFFFEIFRKNAQHVAMRFHLLTIGCDQRGVHHAGTVFVHPCDALVGLVGCRPIQVFDVAKVVHLDEFMTNAIERNVVQFVELQLNYSNRN